jgi:hypothetical protein
MVAYDLTESVPITIASLAGQVGATGCAGWLTDKLNNTDREFEDKMFDECLKESFEE